LEKELSEMRKKLQKAEYDADENWKLVIHACNILADTLEKVHKFKENEERDVLLWHKNYRNQLAVERELNLALNNQINEMRASACRANEYLRQLRRALTDDEDRTEQMREIHGLRTERRFWKRMALPLFPDDDPEEYSSDDDRADPIIVRRLQELKVLAAEEAKREVETLAAKKAKENTDGNLGGNADEGSGGGDDGQSSTL
jgi:hypothetical protein